MRAPKAYRPLRELRPAKASDLVVTLLSVLAGMVIGGAIFAGLLSGVVS